ncbi:hypothetical protein P378_00190 [Desulforamulus profundi]|uniref:Uncharacterized protein n=1 Tax=Desulforamulus profundi TaxID=1383067 RepID=A0A2C6MJE8_9FIRM|nr:hypothetical protein P378_00190 [Desulforamulus profundi]
MKDNLLDQDITNRNELINVMLKGHNGSYFSGTKYCVVYINSQLYIHELNNNDDSQMAITKIE